MARKRADILTTLKKPHVLVAVVSATVVLLLGTAAVGVQATERRWEDLILPGVTAGGIELGELTKEAAQIKLAEEFDALLSEGFAVRSARSETVVPPLLVALDDPDNTRALAVLDAKSTVDAAFAYGHDGSLARRIVAQVTSRRTGHDVPLRVTLLRQELIAAMAEQFRAEETPVVDAALTAAGGARFSVRPAEAGRTYDYNAAVNALEEQLSRGRTEAVTLTLRDAAPAVGDRAVAALVPEAERLAAAAPLVLRDPEGGTWEVTQAMVASWLAVEAPSGTPRLGLSLDAMAGFFDQLAERVETPADDARFRVENGRVVEFAPSKDGITVDRAVTAENIRQALAAGQKEAALVRMVLRPKVATGEANALGITEKLGTGVSDYRGSPRNRIRNIQNAVRKLNGLLIQPGETFSLLEALKPFTLDGGWLPELVIKGDKILPEIGGGACQIGTTTFRAAMNSGLPIVERRNHSLVVRYYNDPANNNPGTDATIYDPAPDFRFLNDTGRIVLFEAVNDTADQKLYFTFWGTSDGRKGSYSAPKVLRWIAAPPDKIVETTELPPGTRECEASHPGAETSFTYTVVMPDGSKKEEVFTSRYRALARTCLVGVEALSVPPPAEGETPTDPAAAPDAAAPAQ